MRDINNLSYNFLLEFYLQNSISGILGDFNKTYFPDDYENMKKELEIVKKANANYGYK